MEEDFAPTTTTTTTSTTSTEENGTAVAKEDRPRNVLHKLLSGNDDEDVDLTAGGKYHLTEEEQNAVEEGMCIECEDQPASVKCDQCEDG